MTENGKSVKTSGRPSMDRIRVRLLSYKRRKQLCTGTMALSGGLLAIIGIGDTGLSSSPRALVSFCVSLVIISVVLYARAYVAWDAAEYELSKYTLQGEEEVAGSSFVPDEYSYPGRAQKLEYVGLVFLILGLITFAVSLWWCALC